MPPYIRFNKNPLFMIIKILSPNMRALYEIIKDDPDYKLGQWEKERYPWIEQAFETLKGSPETMIYHETFDIIEKYNSCKIVEVMREALVDFEEGRG